MTRTANTGDNRRMGVARFLRVSIAATLLSGCNERQSAYHAFGAEAEAVLGLAWWLTGGAVAIAIAMIALIVFARTRPEGSITHNQGMRFIAIVGGIVPALVLLALLLAVLPMMQPISAGRDTPVIEVEGEQFWWRMRYPSEDGMAEVVTANELALPVGRTVILKLTAGDVVHSLWVPGLGGKMDMIPGRTNELVVRAEKPGRFRGQCTEFCGLSHALMAFDVMALSPDDYDAWIARRAADAAPAVGTGRAVFADHGCAACHRIAGHGADGTIGPDLTHFAARATFGAGMFALEEDALVRFIRRSQTMKPGSRMPAFPDMSDAHARAIARYLMELE